MTRGEKRVTTINRFWKPLQLFVVVCLAPGIASLFACAPFISMPTPEQLALTPADARAIVHGANGVIRQTSFTVDRAYPEFPFPELQISKLNDAGWKICKPAVDGWTSFIDATAGGGARRIHQRTLRLVKGNELITLSAQYFSTSPDAVRGARESVPESATQYGMILLLKGSPAEVEAALNSLQSNCAPA